MKAAVLLEVVARFHPLIDGNKRSAWTLMVLLLWINGRRHDFTTDEGFEPVGGVAEELLNRRTPPRLFHSIWSRASPDCCPARAIEAPGWGCGHCPHGRSEGVFALAYVHSGWSGPSDTGRGLCLAPRVASEVVGGERVQGRGWLALRLL
ncbi:Fic family protein [Paenarthrobacter nicotinovorans]